MTYKFHRVESLDVLTSHERSALSRSRLTERDGELCVYTLTMTMAGASREPIRLVAPLSDGLRVGELVAVRSPGVAMVSMRSLAEPHAGTVQTAGAVMPVASDANAPT